MTAESQLVQIALLVCAICAFVAVRTTERVIRLLVIFIPFSALLRRLIDHFIGDGGASASASQSFDTLTLVPLAGVLLLLVRGSTKPAAGRSTFWAGLSALAVALITLGQIVSLLFGGGLAAAPVYYAALTTVPLLLLLFVERAKLPDVWSSVERLLPWLGIVVGAYGVIQFFWLPSWDREWMISSGLTSVGHPYPMQVRVFGTLESPGPFATFIGASMLAAFHFAIVSPGPRRVGHGLIALSLLFPLLLSGVRASLIAVLLCAALLGIATARGLMRALPVAIGAVMLYGLNLVTSRFGGQSMIFSQQRYQVSSFGTDQSVQARLDLLSLARQSITQVIGAPAGGRADNLWVDQLFHYGALAALGVVLLTARVLVGSVRRTFHSNSGSAAVVSLFALVMGAATDIFTFSFGVVAALAFGAVLRNPTATAQVTTPDVGEDDRLIRSRLAPTQLRPSASVLPHR